MFVQRLHPSACLTALSLHSDCLFVCRFLEQRTFREVMFLQVRKKQILATLLFATLENKVNAQGFISVM